jgi:hypothetical protein
MARFIFITTNEENREYKRICMRMAGAMGYTNISIKKAFGHEYKRELDYELTQNLQALYSGSYV